MTALELLQAAKMAGVQLVEEEGRLSLEGAEENIEAFMARYGEILKARRKEVVTLLRGEVADDTRRAQARLEFALAFSAKLEQEMDAGVPEWLEWAFWCLFNDAMEGFVRWGLGEMWLQVQEAALDRQQAAGMRQRALEGWASWYRERERHRYSARWGNLDEAWTAQRDQLALECETWAWRAYLLELALKNPQTANESEIDPWVDLRPWAVLLAKNGQKLGLVWTDRRAA
ncbi:MAG: hypothetical protein N2Z75_09335 [Meiothermus sp.]|nr:hypothetical protein [Meiothermus sp.]